MEGDFSAYLANLQEMRVESRHFLPHQAMISRYLSAFTPYQSLLVFHETGSGKSGVAISVFQELFDFYQGKVLFIYMVNNMSAKRNFKEELDKFMSTKYSNKKDNNNIFLIVYSNDELQRLKNSIKMLVIEKRLPILVVIDEAHNLVTNETIELKTPDHHKINMIKTYVDST